MIALEMGRVTERLRAMAADMVVAGTGYGACSMCWTSFTRRTLFGNGRAEALRRVCDRVNAEMLKDRATEPTNNLNYSTEDKMAPKRKNDAGSDAPTAREKKKQKTVEARSIAVQPTTNTTSTSAPSISTTNDTSAGLPKSVRFDSK